MLVKKSATIFTHIFYLKNSFFKHILLLKTQTNWKNTKTFPNVRDTSHITHMYTQLQQPTINISYFFKYNYYVNLFLNTNHV